eukprot:scaffold69088_cov60-Phaeocystis_antarctica.AAC.3
MVEETSRKPPKALSAMHSGNDGSTSTKPLLPASPEPVSFDMLSSEPAFRALAGCSRRTSCYAVFLAASRKSLWGADHRRSSRASSAKTRAIRTSELQLKLIKVLHRQGHRVDHFCREFKQEQTERAAQSAGTA